MSRLSEPASAKTPLVRKYARLASRYDSRWSSYVNASLERTVERLTLAADERVLDVGCGTGLLLWRLVSTGVPLRLFGVDLCPEMLKVARARLPEGVCLVRARAEALPFPDRALDCVVSTSVFHYLVRPQPALAELHRVLAPGGRLVLTDWCHDYLACRICSRVLRLFTAVPIRTYTRRECEQLLLGVFPRVEVERYRISWLWGLMTAEAWALSGECRRTREPAAPGPQPAPGPPGHPRQPS